MATNNLTETLSINFAIHSDHYVGRAHRLAGADPGHGELEEALDARRDDGADDDLAALGVAGQLQVSQACYEYIVKGFRVK